MNSRISDFIRRIEQATIVRSIRDGLVNLIPVLIIGAFALILNTLPIPFYQDFLSGTAAGGFFSNIFEMVNKATFGVLSVYMTFFVSRSYMKIKADSNVDSAGAAVASVLAFFVLAGANLESFSINEMGPKSMFLALLTALGASALYIHLQHLFHRHKVLLFSKGADKEFNRVLSTIIPITIIAIIFALFNELIILIFNVDSFRHLLIKLFNALFSIGENGFIKGFFFVFLSSILWFFGIHGSDTLEEVMQTFFVPGLEANKAAVASGQLPTNILTKEFFDCFVLMGGCGATICLLIAILIFSRNRARRGLGYTAAFPMLFNINELMVFGLPIIFNPLMLIPFLAVPLACYSVAYAATALGLVPIITSSVEWTTPIILGGYSATGSFAGSILQVVNVAIGVLIYLPFVRLLDKQTAEESKNHYSEFINFFHANETEIAANGILGRGDKFADFAKGLCADMRHDFDNGIKLAYQPQYNYEGKCIGVEALLRWNHEAYGMLYPPLVVQLAGEGNFLPELEEAVFNKAMSEREQIQAQFGENVKISINITGKTIVSQRFLQFIRKINERDPFEGKNVCIEVTEQAMLSLNDESRAILNELRGMGILLAIDDFSMGQTSLHYLKDSLFDIIKLDGSLTKGLMENPNYKQIVSSITQLADSLKLMVLAEFVETENQKEELHNLNCNVYQGYLYSPAVFLKQDK